MSHCGKQERQVLGEQVLASLLLCTFCTFKKQNSDIALRPLRESIVAIGLLRYRLLRADSHLSKVVIRALVDVEIYVQSGAPKKDCILSFCLHLEIVESNDGINKAMDVVGVGRRPLEAETIEHLCRIFIRRFYPA